jgi:siroheme synthase/uroporphyrinogen-III synthase
VVPEEIKIGYIRGTGGAALLRDALPILNKVLSPHGIPEPIPVEDVWRALDDGQIDAALYANPGLAAPGVSKAYLTALLPIEESLGEPAFRRGRIAVTVRAGNSEIEAALQAIDARRGAGLVALVGCPADASMISSRVTRYLDHADIILHDRLVPPEILERYAGKLEEVGKTGGEKSTEQFDINCRMLHRAERGELVVRLQGGDPGIFGRLGEELEFLTAWGIRVDVVPALSAAQVAAARAHAPLTHRNRGRNLTITSGYAAPGNEPGPFRGPEAGNLAIYMVVKQRSVILRKLLDAGWPADTPIIVGERIGYDDECSHVSTLSDLEQLDLQSPSVLLVGLKALNATPVTLFTGTNPEQFLLHGPLIHWPLIRLESKPIAERAAWIQDHLHAARGILFPSRYAVRNVVEAILERDDLRSLQGKLLLAVGPATADELRATGLRADLAAESLGGMQALAEKISPEYRGAYLYPCSDAAPIEKRAALLKAVGVILDPCVFYQNRRMAGKPLPRLRFDRVLFTSASTVQAYFENYSKETVADRTWLAVGPSTLRAIEAAGLQGELLENSAR